MAPDPRPGTPIRPAPSRAPPGHHPDSVFAPSPRHPVPCVEPGEPCPVNWLTAAPGLGARGYCVFALTYGEVSGVPVLRAVAPVADSAAELSTFVTGVLVATDSAQVDIVGHSQGGMMPRYYLRFLGGA